MFLDKPYLVTAQTLTDSKLLHVAKEVVLNEVRENPDFSRRVIEVISRHLYQGIVDLESYTLRSGTERVVDFLLNHELHTRFNGALRVTLPAKKGIIASRLNLTHEHFSRILHELMNKRLIEVEGRQVQISDVGRLREYCTG
jgi:CRP-like cAMP-binding protein